MAGLGGLEHPCRDTPRDTGGAAWHWGSQLGTGSAHTELAERISLAGQGFLKLGLGGQNLANELMAINRLQGTLLILTNCFAAITPADRLRCGAHPEVC